RFEPVLLLCIFARNICGIIADGNSLIYAVLNMATNYLPLIAFCLVRLAMTGGRVEIRRGLDWTLAYTVCLVFYILISPATSTGMLFLRVVPMIMVLIYFYGGRIEINAQSLILAIRLALIASLFIYFVFPYKEMALD